ncbi:hypothetical protein SPM77_23120, partial [Enterobacter hormaechei subsp. xiangfangensis]
MVIFGLPFFQIYGLSGVRHETYNLTNFRSFITFAVVAGIILTGINMLLVSKEGANKRGNSSRLTQSFHFFMFEPIFSPVNA